MLKLLILCLLYIASSISFADSLPTSLAQYAWKNRIILIFSPNDKLVDHSAALVQFQEMTCDITDRDLILIQLIKNKLPVINGQVAKASIQDELRHFYKTDDDKFTVILIGKDRYEKYRRSYFNLQEILGEIDLMPMRESEMQQSSHSC